MWGGDKGKSSRQIIPHCSRAWCLPPGGGGHRGLLVVGEREEDCRDGCYSGGWREFRGAERTAREEGTKELLVLGGGAERSG